MITIENIYEWAKPHKLGRGRQVRLRNKIIEISIVGGDNGLYGDFVDNFEIAIMERKTGNFITKFFIDCHDDVVPYIEKEELISTLNTILGNNFQVC